MLAPGTKEGYRQSFASDLASYRKLQPKLDIALIERAQTGMEVLTALQDFGRQPLRTRVLGHINQRLRGIPIVPVELRQKAEAALEAEEELRSQRDALRRHLSHLAPNVPGDYRVQRIAYDQRLEPYNPLRVDFEVHTGIDVLEAQGFYPNLWYRTIHPKQPTDDLTLRIIRRDGELPILLIPSNVDQVTVRGTYYADPGERELTSDFLYWSPKPTRRSRLVDHREFEG